jgi:hypothetical protein
MIGSSALRKEEGEAMMTVTSREHKCVSCGQFSKVLTCTQNPLTHSEVLLCPTCFAWRVK